MRAYGTAREFFEGFVTTEARIAVTVAVLIVSLAVATVIVPRVLFRGGRWLRRQFELDETLVSLPLGPIVRTVQSAIVVLAGLAVLVIWGYLGLAADIVALLAAAVPIAVRLLLTVGLLAAGVVGTRVLEARVESYVAATDHINQHQESVTFRVLQLSVFTAVGLAALSLWNVNLSGLLVGAGFLGIVVGMAARQTLGSLFAGFVLMFSRPFEIGDWVRIKDQEGTVTDITIINTRIQSLDGETIVIPNDNVSNSTVINYTDHNRLRLRVEVGVDYGADLDRARDIARETIADLDRVRPSPRPQVVPTAFGDSAVVLEARFWIDQPNAFRRAQVTAEVVEAIKTAYDEAEIAIPFPQRTIGRRARGDLDDIKATATEE
jgi:small-conductance mechanosensitive channel